MNTSQMMSTRAAIEIADQIIREAAIRGMREYSLPAYENDYLSVEFKRGWAVGCTLYVRFGSGRREPVFARRRSEVLDHRWIQSAEIEVAWSSTGRSVASATAAIALYREVVELAALIESRLGEETIGWSENARAEQARARQSVESGAPAPQEPTR